MRRLISGKTLKKKAKSVDWINLEFNFFMNYCSLVVNV